MKPTIEILTKLQENSKKHHDEVFTRLYRYLLRPDIILFLTSTSTPMKGLEQKAWMKIRRMDSARSMWSVLLKH